MKKKLKDCLTTNEFSILQSSGIGLQDIVSLYYDLKPLLRIGISHLNSELFNNILPVLGFKFKIIDSTKSKAPCKNNPTCLISRSEKTLNKYNIVEISRMNVNNPTTISLIGEYLGYPNCCIKKYTKNLFLGKNNNLPVNIYSNIKEKINFRLNFIYNFESRILNHQEFSLISKSYRLSYIYLLPHKPCSSNCKESIKYAQKIIDILKIDFPKYYDNLLFYLKKPTLYFSDFVFFPLNGKMEGDTFRYKDFIKIHDRLPIETLNLLNKGNIIKKNNNHFKIYKDDLCIMDKLPENVRLFNFE